MVTRLSGRRQQHAGRVSSSVIPASPGATGTAPGCAPLVQRANRAPPLPVGLDSRRTIPTTATYCRYARRVSRPGADVTDTPRPVADAAALATVYADRLLVGTTRDVHRAIARRVLDRRRVRARTPVGRLHDGITAAVYGGIGPGHPRARSHAGSLGRDRASPQPGRSAPVCAPAHRPAPETRGARAAAAGCVRSSTA